MFKSIFANHISDYEKLIHPDDGFIKRIDYERGYVAYDTGHFSHPGKFPEITENMSDTDINEKLLKRDLRGIKFSLATGKNHLQTS